MLNKRAAFESRILSAKVRQLGAQEPSWVFLGRILGSLGAPFRAQLVSFFQVWFQGGSQGGFWVLFLVILEVILVGLLRFSESILVAILKPAV